MCVVNLLKALQYMLELGDVEADLVPDVNTLFYDMMHIKDMCSD